MNADFGMDYPRPGDWDFPASGDPQDDDLDELDEGGDCSWCGGDGWQECDDPIQCCSPHYSDGTEPCGACYGTGDRKHQWIW